METSQGRGNRVVSYIAPVSSGNLRAWAMAAYPAPPITVRLSQKTTFLQACCPSPQQPTTFSWAPRTQAHSLLVSWSLAFLVILSPNPKRWGEVGVGSRCWQPLPQGRQLKKAEKTQAGCVSSCQASYVQTSRAQAFANAVLSCTQYGYLTTEKTRVRKACQ